MKLLTACFGGQDHKRDSVADIDQSYMPTAPLEQAPPATSFAHQPNNPQRVWVSYQPAPPVAPRLDQEFGFPTPAPKEPELETILSTLMEAHKSLSTATSFDDKIHLCNTIDRAACRLQAASTWLTKADRHDVDAWLACNKNRATPAPPRPAISTTTTTPTTTSSLRSKQRPQRHHPVYDSVSPLGLLPAFSRMPSLGGRPSAAKAPASTPNAAANFISGDFDAWLSAAQPTTLHATNNTATGKRDNKIGNYRTSSLPSPPAATELAVESHPLTPTTNHSSSASSSATQRVNPSDNSPVHARTLKYDGTQHASSPVAAGSSSSSAADTHSDAGSVAELSHESCGGGGCASLLVTANTCLSAVAYAAAEEEEQDGNAQVKQADTVEEASFPAIKALQAQLESNPVTPRGAVMPALDKTTSIDSAAACLEAALSNGLSTILYHTPEHTPMHSPRSTASSAPGGPLYQLFNDSTSMSPMLSPISRGW